jgi:hypothetical protein
MNKIYNKVYIARTPTIGPFKQSFIAAIQPEDSSRSTMSTTIIKGLASKQKKDRLPNLFFHTIKRSTTLFSITH